MTVTINVLVVVPTFRRVTWLAELLTALWSQLDDVPGAFVLVLDNDPNGSGQGICNHPIIRAGMADYQHVGAGDVVSVRNAALAEAHRRGASYLVFLDDDELPMVGWLAALDRTRREYEAEIVAGPVRQMPDMLRRPHVAAILRRDERSAGPFEGDVGTGNVLLSTDFVRRTALRFDPRLGRLGGEDTLFFRQAARNGARICWAPEAVVMERGDPARLTRRALLRRSFRNGRSSVVAEEVLDRRAPAVRRWALFVGSAVIHGAGLAVSAGRGRTVHAWVLAYKLARHAGRAAGAGNRAGGYGGDTSKGPSRRKRDW